MRRLLGCSSAGRLASPEAKVNPNSSSVATMAEGPEGVAALGTRVRSAMVEGRRASSGATLAGVSLVAAVGFETTTSAVASSVAV